MNLVVHDSALLLERSQTVELIDAAGATARLDQGCVWITMDGDCRDIVLCAGDSWVVERNGRTLLHADSPATLRITGAAANDERAASWQHRLASVGHWFGETFRRTEAPYY